ncbi:hypothetical protein HYV31_01675 [candidate division WWE3 bacterium]|nr:hypothetical protein [candidate division WWE3 bacterium]
MGIIAPGKQDYILLMSSVITNIDNQLWLLGTFIVVSVFSYLISKNIFKAFLVAIFCTIFLAAYFVMSYVPNIRY